MRNNFFEVTYYKQSLIWNVAALYSLFLYQPVFQENKIYIFKFTFVFIFKHQTNKSWYFLEQDSKKI